MLNSTLKVVLTVSALLFSTVAHAQLSYQIQDLGVIGGTSSIGADVNDSGTAIGLSTNGVGNSLYPAYWKNQTDGFQQIGTQPGDPEQINNADIVVGGADFQSGNSLFRAPFRYDVNSNDFSYLGLADGTVVEGQAFGINNMGTTVGQFEDAASNEKRAFIWQDSTTGVTSLGTVTGSGDSRAEDINNNGQIVGQSEVNVTGGTAPACRNL